MSLVFKEVKSSYLDDIRAFRRMNGLSINDYLDTKQLELHQSLISEEFLELLNSKSIIDQADALVDMVYVLLGHVVHDESYGIRIMYFVNLIIDTAYKYGVDFDACWNEIHSSNMSKACSTLDEAQESVDAYRLRNIDCSIRPVANKYVIVCDVDHNGEIKQGKVLKSINYRPADLTNIVPKDTPDALALKALLEVILVNDCYVLINGDKCCTIGDAINDIGEDEVYIHAYCKQGNLLGVFFLVFGNNDDDDPIVLVCDHSDNAYCDDVIKRTEQRLK